MTWLAKAMGPLIARGAAAKPQVSVSTFERAQGKTRFRVQGILGFRV